MALSEEKGAIMHHSHAVRYIAVALVALLTLALVAPAAAQGGDTLVSVSSPSSPFSQNKQNEPALAVDANPPRWPLRGGLQRLRGDRGLAHRRRPRADSSDRRGSGQLEGSGDRLEAVLDDVQRQRADLGRQRGEQPVLW